VGGPLRKTTSPPARRTFNAMSESSLSPPVRAGGSSGAFSAGSRKTSASFWGSVANPTIVFPPGAHATR